MFSALDVDLRPGLGLGLFNIGSSLWSVLDLLRHNNTMFPRVDVKFDPDASSTTPVILHIPPHLDLLFTGHQQRLSTISLRRLRDPSPPLTLRYKDDVLSSSEERLRRVDISRSFGPTYPGEGLNYPGVSFSFEDGLNDGLKASNAGVDERMREVKRVIVTQNNPAEEELDTLDEVLECPAMFGSIKQATVKLHFGVVFKFYPSSSEPMTVQKGVTSAQDLICDLGSPLRVYYKEDDRMAIHSTRKASHEAEDGYFYSYFQHGVDFLISGTTHIVQKIILHSNIPGSPMFQRYQRCPWEIEGAAEDEEDDSPRSVHFFDKFDTISHFLASSSRDQAPSMLMDRADDDMLTLPNSTTRLIGFDGIILEVTESAQASAVREYLPPPLELDVRQF